MQPSCLVSTAPRAVDWSPHGPILQETPEDVTRWATKNAATLDSKIAALVERSTSLEGLPAREKVLAFMLVPGDRVHSPENDLVGTVTTTEDDTAPDAESWQDEDHPSWRVMMVGLKDNPDDLESAPVLMDEEVAVDSPRPPTARHRNLTAKELAAAKAALREPRENEPTETIQAMELKVGDRLAYVPHFSRELIGGGHPGGTVKKITRHGSELEIDIAEGFPFERHREYEVKVYS